MPRSDPGARPRDLTDHLNERIAGLRAEVAERDDFMRRIARALGMAGDPLDERIAVEAERQHAELVRARPVVRAVREWRRRKGDAFSIEDLSDALDELERGEGNR